MSDKTDSRRDAHFAGKVAEMDALPRRLTLGKDLRMMFLVFKVDPGERAVPILSMFYGIVIRMYFYDNKQHHAPHLHAEYAGKRSVFNLEDGEVLSGELPPGKARMVQAWIEIHRDELLADWELAVNGEDVFKIEPLK